MNRKLYILIFGLLISTISFAQEDKEDKYKNADKSTPDFLLEKDSIFVSKKKKKKRKKKTFNKLKTKRGYTKRGSGRGLTIEQFFYLKKFKEPSDFITPIFIYDITKLKVIKLKKYDINKYPPKQFKIMHGPYVRKKGSVVLEEGYFWIGTKHDNWFKYKGESEIVLERNEYHKGFPAKYEIKYYDPANKTEVKEINPIDGWNNNSGSYKFYFKSGRVQISGKLEKGLKVGNWYEYYTNGRKKKQSTYVWDDKQKLEIETIVNEWNPDKKLKKKYLERDRKIAEEKAKNRPKMKF